MKSFNLKSLICGLLIGTIGTIGITSVFASGTIKSAQYEEGNISFNGSIIPLKNSLVSVVKNGENESKIYMPAEEVLEYLGYNVECADSKHLINISTRHLRCKDSIEECSVSNKNEVDKQALEIMQKTGNWNYVKPLFPSMTSEGVQAVVNLYIQKTGNYKKAEEASKYINKDNSTTKVETKLDYDALASETMADTGNIYSIMMYMPNMSKDKVDKIVKDYIDKTNDFICIYNARSFMSTKGIDETVRSYVDGTSDYGTVAAMLQFMSTDASDYVAKKYMKEEKNEEYRKFFTPYLNN